MRCDGGPSRMECTKRLDEMGFVSVQQCGLGLGLSMQGLIGGIDARPVAHNGFDGGREMFVSNRNVGRGNDHPVRDSVDSEFMGAVLIVCAGIEVNRGT